MDREEKGICKSVDMAWDPNSKRGPLGRHFASSAVLQKRKRIKWEEGPINSHI